jgi:hypothetical protein
MIFELEGYLSKTATLVSTNGTAIPFQINPESIRDTTRTSIASVPTINSNLPRRIINGAEHREISFTALFHGMTKYKADKVSANKRIDKSSADIGSLVGVSGRTLTNAGVNLVPFASNIVRGVKTVTDLAGIDSQGIFRDEEFKITTDYETADIESVIKMLLHMQIPLHNRAPMHRVKVLGYSAFKGMEFYITEVSINRRLWDKRLNTQFAEIRITLTQLGANTKVGRFFSRSRGR